MRLMPESRPGIRRCPIGTIDSGALVRRTSSRPASELDAAADNAVVVALGTADDDDLSRLRAGEATSVVLLTATALGLSSCPITEPLEIAETREAVRADVLGEDGHPQMLLRIGWAPVNSDPLARHTAPRPGRSGCQVRRFTTRRSNCAALNFVQVDFDV